MRQDRILLAHGSGGTMMRELIEDVFITTSTTRSSRASTTQRRSTLPGSRIAMSTDTFVVNPLFFPGGDIGRLAVCGTVNDVATSGAKPLYLSVGFILEEGFRVDDLERILVSMRDVGRRGRRPHRHRRHQGRREGPRRRHLHQHRRRRRRCPTASTSPSTTASPATRCCSPARSAITASRSSPRARV